MSKFLKFIVNLFLICAILAAAAILIPPIVGVQTTIIDSASMDTNLPLGSITYSTDITADEMKNGDEVLKDSSSSTYAYIIKGKGDDANEYRVVSATDKNGAEETVSFEGSVPRVRVIVPFLGYIIIAMHSTEGLIIIGLVVALVIILFILSELWKKEPEDEEETETEDQKAAADSVDARQDRKDKKAAKKAEKAKAKQAKKDKKRGKAEDESTGSSAQPAADAAAEEPILPRPDVKVDINPEIPDDLPEISISSRDDDGGTSDDELNNFLLKEENSSDNKEEPNPDKTAPSEEEVRPVKAEPAAETQPAAEPDEETVKPLEQEVGVNEVTPQEEHPADITANVAPANDEPAHKTEDAPENGAKKSSDGETAASAPMEKAAEKEAAPAEPEQKEKPAAPDSFSTAATQKIELPDEFDLSEAIETATKEAEAKAEEARSRTTPIHLPKDAYSLDNLKEDEPEPADDSNREFTPVEHATLDELLDQAKKDGEEPEVRKDDATGITFVDYSDEL